MSWKDKFLNKVVQEENCEHVKYALNLSKVQKALREKGWIIEGGEIIQRPF